MSVGGLRDVQDILDEHKERIPEGAYVQLCEAIARLYRTQHVEDPRTYYQAVCVEVYMSHRRMIPHQTVILLEEVDRSPLSADPWAEAMRTATVSADLVRSAVFPMVLRDPRGGCLIVCSCEQMEDGSVSEL